MSVRFSAWRIVGAMTAKGALQTLSAQREPSAQHRPLRPLS